MNDKPRYTTNAALILLSSGMVIGAAGNDLWGGLNQSPVGVGPVAQLLVFAVVALLALIWLRRS